MTTEPATRPPDGHTDVVSTPSVQPAAGRQPARRWTRWLPRYPWSGTAGALLLGCSSLTPSLLPRGWLLQGLIAGITAAIGYGLGVAVAWFVAAGTDRRRPAASRRLAWQALAVAGPALLLIALGFGLYWQQQVHLLMGLDPPEGYSAVGIVVVAGLVFAGRVAIAPRGRGAGPPPGRGAGRGPAGRGTGRHTSELPARPYT